MNRTLRHSAIAPVAIFVFTALASAGSFVGPSPYLSFADSPFSGGGFGYFHLETFEDGLLNTPGVTASGGLVTSPSGATDSVDGDDGFIDGLGMGGRSLISIPATTLLRFDFDAGVLGALPTHAGIVWTDVGNTASGPLGISEVIFRAFGPGLAPLGSIGPVTLGDGSVLGGTAEDRFFGIVSGAGISRIEIEMPNSTDWEVDHLQYGAIPAPGAATAMALLGVTAFRRRR